MCYNASQIFLTPASVVYKYQLCCSLHGWASLATLATLASHFAYISEDITPFYCCFFFYFLIHKDCTSRMSLFLFWDKQSTREENVNFSCGDDNSKPTWQVFMKPRISVDMVLSRFY